MPDTRHHRGPHPEDPELFGAAALPALGEAVRHLSWLLTRGYAMPSALKLVGDRFSLRKRQRTAVMRSACADQARLARGDRRLAPAALAGRALAIDGLNVLTTIEAALGGAVLLRGRDGALRDLASVHGTWRSVEETPRAIRLAGDALARLGPAPVTWYLDRPVSNSGRLKVAIDREALAAGWTWRVDLVGSPDAVLSYGDSAAITTDSVILDRAPAWFDLAAHVVAEAVPTAWVVDLSGP